MSRPSFASVSMLRRVIFCAIRNGFGPNFSKNIINFRGRKNFAFEIAQKRAEINAAWWCAASSRPLEVPNISCERKHAVPRAIACDSEQFSEPYFRNFSRPQKFCVRNRARSRQNPWRLAVRSFLTTLRGPKHLLRASACCAE